MTQPTNIDHKSIEEQAVEIQSETIDCVYGMNIDCSMKEVKRLYAELGNSRFLRKKIIDVLFERDAIARQQEREKLRIHIEREVIDPLIDTFKDFGSEEDIVNTLRSAFTPNDKE